MLLAASALGVAVAAGAVGAIVTIVIFHICSGGLYTPQGLSSDQMRQLWSGVGQCGRPSPAPMRLPQSFMQRPTSDVH